MEADGRGCCLKTGFPGSGGGDRILAFASESRDQMAILHSQEAE